MFKIDVKDWPDNLHGGERVMARLRPWTLEPTSCGGGPGTCLLRERYFGEVVV